MMFSSRRHYEPGSVAWKRKTAVDTIKHIVDEVIAQALSGEKWQKHPLDEGGQLKSDFYLGRGGSLWAVDHLQRVGAVKTSFDISGYLDSLVADNRKQRNRLPHPDNASYLFGELPLLLMQYRINPSQQTADEIADEISRNNTQPVRELMWGLAGSMLAALTMYQWTDDKRWVTLYRNQSRIMLSDWNRVKGVGYLWNVALYRSEACYLGAVHGFTGNALALIRGFDLLPKKQVEQTTKRIMTTIVNTALVDGEHANWWPTYTEETRNPKKQPLVQLCHGAPGIIIPLASLPTGINEHFDELLLMGGELIWDAGLLEKGPNLCHGTSGNGYAFLKLYQRTGDAVWLKRARAYAMHAIEQYHEIRDHYKKPRFPLWTGDTGMAIYLWNCIREEAMFPTLDNF